MRINELTSPYRELAEKRMQEYKGFINTDYILISAFDWVITPEGVDFWNEVSKGNTPEISKSSLDEITETKQPEAKDIKHMQELRTDLLSCSKKDDRLFTAAVAAMQVLINKPSYSNEGLAFEAWDYAEALIAEGKKRNHL